jgi:HPt (histidine-containing phosphotransfer) domain-containing protein
MNDYLAKPIMPKDLAGMLDKWLNKAPEQNPDVFALNAMKETTEGLPVFDRQVLLNSLMDNEQLVKTITKIFLEDLPGRIVELSEYVKQNDPEKVKMQAHMIKGASASVSGVALSAVATEMVWAAESGMLGNMKSLVKELEIQFELLRKEMLKQNIER